MKTITQLKETTLRRAVLRLAIVVVALLAPVGAWAHYVPIGTYTASDAHLPFYNYYKYSLSQQIYTASEIGCAGKITTVYFWKDGTENSNGDRMLDIYMAHTTKSSFSSSTDWVALSESDRVYHATSTVNLHSQGANGLTLDTPFEYNGTDNLIVVVIDRTGTCSSSASTANKQGVFTTSSYQALYHCSDNNSNLNPNGTNGTTPVSGTRVQFKNWIRFWMCTPPSNLTVTDITSHSASLGWSSYEDAGWYIYHSTSSTPPTLSTTPTIDGTRTEPEKLENLQPSTTYYAWVRTSCSDWSEGVSFTTSNCNPINVTASGWTEDFENQASWEVPDCWDNSMSTSPSLDYIYMGCD